MRTNVSLLFCTFMIRHGRPTTLCSFAENVIGPEIVGRARKLSNASAIFGPFVSPPVFFRAAASASIVAAPSAKLAVYGICFAASSACSSLFTAGFGSLPNDDA